MRQGEIYDEHEEELAEARSEGAREAIDDFYYTVLRNPLTIDALTITNDRYEVLAILKRQYDEMKMSII